MRTLAVITALVTLSTSMLAAQMPVEGRNPRQGFWVGLGLGAGSAGTHLAGVRSGRTTAPSGYARLGGTVSQSLLVGGETSGWVDSHDGASYLIEAVSAVVLWYPDRTGAFYLKFGLGALRYSASDWWRPSVPVAAADVFFPFYWRAEEHMLAPLAAFGLGYEFRVSRATSVNAFVNGLASSAAKFEASDPSQLSSPDVKVNLIQVGLGLTWH
jgi:hypothetical protein